MNDNFDELFNISTSGVQESFNDEIHYFIYEPTSYYVLKSLLNEYPLLQDDQLVDFGSGKGRLNFFMYHFFNCYVTGIEMNTEYFNDSLDNLNNYSAKYNVMPNKIKFINCTAEEYEINKKDNKFYFFNPFSVKIFIKVIMNIMLSTAKNPRSVDLILFYPSEDYIYFLENYTSFKLFKEIPMIDHYENDNREKVLIYRLN